MKTSTGHFVIGQEKVPYILYRSPRRRRTIQLFVEKQENIRILAPLRADFANIQRLVDRQLPWIVRRLEHFRQKRLAGPRTFMTGETILYRGSPYPLRIVNDAGRKQGCTPQDGCIEVNTHDAAFSSEEIRMEILLWLKKEARAHFKPRVDLWRERMGVKYRSFTVSNPRSLWGSCSARNDVRLSWRLIMAPPELLDYVIVHELAHIVHKNHSRRFWRLVETFIPGCKQCRKELRGMSALLSL